MNARLALLMRLSITLVVVVFAAVVTRWMWIHYELAPWSRDGRVRADVVTVAPDVAGFVMSVAVVGKQTGRKGAPLVHPDPGRHQISPRPGIPAVPPPPSPPRRGH